MLKNKIQRLTKLVLTSIIIVVPESGHGGSGGPDIFPPSRLLTILRGPQGVFGSAERFSSMFWVFPGVSSQLDMPVKSLY